MGTIIVNIMLKPEVVDSAGNVVAKQLADLGYSQFLEVRQGKRFTFSIAGLVTPEALAAARAAAESALIDKTTEEVVSVRDGADEGIDWDDMPEIWDDGAMLTAAEGMRDQGQDPRAVRGHATGAGRAVSPEMLQDLSGTAGHGVYGGGTDDDR